MDRRVGVGNILQAAIFFVAAGYFWPRWQPIAVVLGLTGGLQLLAALALVYLKRPRWTRWASGLSLVAIAIIAGLFVHAALHLVERFGEQAAYTGKDSLLGLLLGLPWLLGFPLWQVFALRTPSGPDQRRRADSRWMVMLILIGLVLPPAVGAWEDRPIQVWPAQPELALGAQAAWLRWTSGDGNAELPAGNGPVQLLLTPWQAGAAGRTVRGEGENLAEALDQALGQIEPWSGEGGALVVDLAREQLPGGAHIPGESGALADDGGLSPSVAWRPGNIAPLSVFYRWSVPGIRPSVLGGSSLARFDSFLVDEHGARALRAGWTEPEALTAESARDAALAGAMMLSRNQDEAGRFTYLVKGPGGERGPGYNLPRHAGTTWFLARMTRMTDEPELAVATDLALEWMVARTTYLSEDVAFFAGSKREDGKVWVGTTSLAVLGAVERDHEIAPIWGRFLASSVDARGQVRGEANRADGSFSPQVQNPYGQGQTLLALASLVRAGHEEFRPALERGAAWLESGYAPLGSGRLVTIDEHWSCLAALAIRDVLGEPAGLSLCTAYLRNHSIDPAPDQGLRTHVASAGGVAEAVVAAAVLEPEGPWRERALAYGELMLEAQYRPEDAPFLGRPEALIGGFRTFPHRLDVQIDTVQHVGCALLGIASLMDGDTRAGSLP